MMWAFVRSGWLPGFLAGLAVLVLIVLMIPNFRQEPDFEGMTNLQIVLMFGLSSLVMFTVVVGPLTSFIFGCVQGWVSNPVVVFRAALIGLGVVLSVLAFLVKTPMPLEKTISNLIVTTILAVLTPLLHR